MRLLLLAALAVVGLAVAGVAASAHERAPRPHGGDVSARRVVSSTAATQVKVSVPAYFYPGATWDQLASAAGEVGYVIANPMNGPGSSPNPEYLAAIQRARAAGQRVLGYVHTSYGARDAGVVRGDIDRWYEWYPVDGIFLDEAAAGCDTVQWYGALRDHVRTHAAGAVTALNPGMTPSECLMAAGDVVMTFEGTASSYRSFQLAGWERAYPRGRFWHLVHGAPSSALRSTIDLVKQRHVGHAYITPDVMPNPWDTLPPSRYWSDQLQRL